MSDRSRTIYRPPWRIDLVARQGVTSPLADSDIASAVAGALEAGRSPRPASVTIVLTDDAELTDLNREHMGVDGPTDVLSFPMLPPEAYEKGHAAPAQAAGRGRVHVGDIAVSVERAIAQAETGRGGQTSDVRWSPADEVRLLVTHGTLHLCGRDHAEPEEEAAMRALERELLDRPRPGPSLPPAQSAASLDR